MLSMMRKRAMPWTLFAKTPRNFSACPLLQDPPTPSTRKADHESFCLSLIDQLIQRGLFSSAQQVIQRIIVQSTSLPELFSAIDFATFRGMDLDLSSYGVLIWKLMDSGQTHLAEYFYHQKVLVQGTHPDLSILNSMVICFCRLGKLDDAIADFDRIVSMNSAPCVTTCDMLLRHLCSQGRVLEAFDCFMKIDEVGGLVGCSSFSVLIDGLSFRGYVDEALEVFDVMCTRTGAPPTAHLYKSLVYGLCKRGRVVEAECLCGNMENDGFFVDRTMYTSLMHEYCKDRKMKMAMRVFYKMLKMGWDPDKYVFKTLIDGFFRLGLIGKAEIIYNQMEDRGLQPDLVTYHIMISGYCRAQKVDRARTLFKSMITSGLSPTVHFYTVLIAGFCKANREADVQEVCNDMLENGVVPDHVLFFTLMKSCPKGHELQLSLVLLKAVSKNGCGFDPCSVSLPTASNPTKDVEQEIEFLLEKIAQSNLCMANVAYSIFISALCAIGRSSCAWRYMDKLSSTGCKPLLSSYNSLIKCHCQVRLVNGAQSLLDRMQDHGMFPNQATCLVLAHELCKRGNSAAACDILYQMDGFGLKPDVAIYDTIIVCLGRQKRVFEAENMFKKMLEAGVDPDEGIFTTMINAYCKNGRPLVACELFDKMIEQGFESSYRVYIALITGLIKKNKLEKGCMYLQRMLQDGFKPNNVLYTALIQQFLRKGDIEFALQLADSMETDQLEHDLITVIAILSGISQSIPTGKRKSKLVNRSRKEKEKLLCLLKQRRLFAVEKTPSVQIQTPEEIKYFALSRLRKFKNTQFIPNLYICNSIISGLCKAGVMHEAHEYLEVMYERGMRPNQVTFTILMNSHIINNETDDAVMLFNKINADDCPPDKIAYNTLISGLCKAGRLLDALTLSHLMYKRGLFPNMFSYEKLLSCLFSEGLGMQAFKLYEDMIGNDYMPCMYYRNLLFCILCEENRRSEACVVFYTMLKRGKSPNEMTKRFSLGTVKRELGEPSRLNLR